MNISFLTANSRLAKTFTPEKTEPYPHVSKFTSHTHNINTINDFYTHINHYAALGGCLLKGELTKELVNESRAGSTHSNTPTQWVVMDFDRLDPVHTKPEHIIQRCLPDCFHTASYIWQWSNSARITKHGVIGHAFFLLKNAIDVKLLKQILMEFNFAHELLNTQLKLNAGGHSLNFPLDITCAQNDKLIFIAPPTLNGIQDPFGDDRIFMVTKDHDHVGLDTTQYDFATIDHTHRQKIKELRREAGLATTKPNLKTDGSTLYLKNPDQAVFRGPYITARGFVYGNLNNGDSYAYFHTEENPKFLFNFKGDHVYRLQDIDPDYWRALQDRINPIDTSKKYYIFRERRTDTYFTLIYHPNNDTYKIDKVRDANRAMDFLRFYRQPVPEVIPIWDAIFEPNNRMVVDPKKGIINMFQASEYLKNAKPSSHQPVKFFELLMHLVNNNDEMRDEVLNWLAFKIQTMSKAQTSIIMHGTTGTGKGVFFNKILSPIFGERHCKIILMEDIDATWNDWIETAVLILVDEANISDDIKKAKKRLNKLKNLITEPKIMLKQKFANHLEIENHVDFIFTSNEHDSIWLNDNDRRYKVCDRQENPINYTKEDIDELQNELQEITNYLIWYPYDEKRVRSIPKNAAREQLIKASHMSIDEFIDLIKKGDLHSFQLYETEESTNNHSQNYAAFVQILKKWQYNAENGIDYVTTSDLRIAYMYMFNTEIGASRFGRILNQNSIAIIPRSIRDEHGNIKSYRTVNVQWSLENVCLGATADLAPMKSVRIN
jgi:hypothetical protein